MAMLSAVVSIGVIEDLSSALDAVPAEAAMARFYINRARADLLRAIVADVDVERAQSDEVVG